MTMTRLCSFIFALAIASLLQETNGLNIAPPRKHVKPIKRRAVLITATATLVTAGPAVAKSYSQNARNMERLNAGDSSGGSVYDNDPTSASARKRRAMTGCKIPSTRAEAADIQGLAAFTEKDCNIQVMGGNPDTMLQAIRNLECPTCPYGISETRK